MRNRAPSEEQSRSLVLEVSYVYLEGGSRIDVACRMHKMLDRLGFPPRYFPSPDEMDALVQAGRTRAKKVRAEFRKEALAFADAIQGPRLKTRRTHR